MRGTFKVFKTVDDWTRVWEGVYLVFIYYRLITLIFIKPCKGIRVILTSLFKLWKIFQKLTKGMRGQFPSP